MDDVSIPRHPDTGTADKPETRSPPRPQRGRGVRWWLRQVHLWVGLVLCVPLVLIGLTGSYLTYHAEIDALFAPAAPRGTDGPAQPMEAIVAAALATAPAGYTTSMMQFPERPGAPATVRVGPPDAGFRDPRVRAIAIDPVSLATTAVADSAAVGMTRLMHGLHGHLMLPGFGRQAVGWLGVVMLALGFSGLVLWWPRGGKLKAALTVKRGARGYRLHRDLHGVAGFWSLLVFVAVSFTGVYIAFPQTFSAAAGWLTGDPPAAVRPPQVHPVDGVEPLDLAQLADVARQAVPDAELRSVGMPFRPGQPARATFDVPGAADGAPSLAVMIDPWRRRVVEVRDPRAFSPREAVDAWQRPLHEGGGLGPVWRFLVFLSGLLPLLFAITGVSMWLIGRRARRG